MNQQVENIMNNRPIGEDYFRVRQIIKKRPRPQTKDSVLNIDERAHRVMHNLNDRLGLDPKSRERINWAADKGVDALFGVAPMEGAPSMKEALRMGRAIKSGSFSNIFNTGLDIAQEKTRKIAGKELNPAYAAMTKIPGFDSAVKDKFYDPNPVRQLEHMTGMHVLDYVHNWELLMRPDKLVSNIGKFVADDVKGIWHAFGWLGDQLNKI